MIEKPKIKPKIKTEFKIFIGSNNKTEEVDLKKIEKTLNRNFQGYTILNSIGYWNYTKEKSVVVSIITDKPINYLLSVVALLKKQLGQYLILLTQEEKKVYEV